MSMLDYRRAASYTPDFTANLLRFVNLTGTQFLTDKLLLSGNVYYRHLMTGAANGNINDNYLANYTGPPFDCTAPPASLTNPTSSEPVQTATSLMLQTSKSFGLKH